jgi:iron complex transport system permease protein
VSLAGAAIVLLIVLGVAVEGRRLSSFTLLLTGVTMNSMSFAIIMFLHNLANFSQSFAISRWLMGGLDAVEYSTLAWLAAAVLPVCLLVTLRAPQWNLLAVGDDWAASRGVHTSALTIFGYIAGSILTGLVTALTGPIGFVGLIVPHALRLKFGADHRVLLPCAFLAGAAFLCVCDTLARTVIAPTEIPVGVLTALAGGPFFIWLLRSRRRSLWL